MRHDDRVHLGRTGVEVTRLGLGLAPLGGLFAAVGDTPAYETLERAWDLGIRYFDTAPLYGSGLSERRAGHVLRDKPRAEFALSTKVGRRLEPSGGDIQQFWAESTSLAPIWDFSADGTRRSYSESLERMGLESADVLHIHDPDEHYQETLAGALPALRDLRSAGRVGAVSAGMNQAPMLADLVRTGDLDCVLLAGRYSLLDQSGLAELLPLCATRGVSVIVGGVFNSGVLADPDAGTDRATFDYGPVPTDVLARARAIREVCERHGVPLRAAALRFPFGHPAVSTVLVGARSADEVFDAVAMFSVDIPGQLWRDLGRAGLLPEEVPTP